MDGGVIAAQEEAHRQEMMQQVLSPIFFKLKVALGANMLNFRESTISDFGGKKVVNWSQPRESAIFCNPNLSKGKYCFQ